MDKIINELKQHKIYVKDLFILRNGETSNTYLAKLHDKKIILKIFKNNNLKININSYLEINVLEQLIQNKILLWDINLKHTQGLLKGLKEPALP